MSESLSLSELSAAVAGQAAAFRSITRLQPVDGIGGKIFPATYAGGEYATETRALEGETVPVNCTLLDSVQSQANRAEEALKSAIERGEMSLPLITVDFTDANKDFRVDIPTLTSLDVPHRLADALLRDSELSDGTRFSRSGYAQRWSRSTVFNATAVYELCPTALLFGLWGSPDKPGGLGAKFERAYVSEIVAVDVQQVPKREGFRIDPVNANKNIKIKQDAKGGFAVDKGTLKPSEINHGNIIFESPNGGVRCRFAEQTTVVSLGVLRKLRFPKDGANTTDRDNAARTVLAALGLCAGVLASERVTSLRSRCQLWPTEARVWQLLEIPGRPPREFALTGEAVLALFKEAVGAAAKHGLLWDTDPIRLTPTKELRELIKKSQDLAAKESGEEEKAKAAEASQ